MNQIGVHEFQQDPLGWLKRVEAGETLLIVRENHPVAEVKPVTASLDRAAHNGTVSLEEFDRILDEVSAPPIGGPSLSADFSRVDIYSDHD